jgi:hypothetical protein
VSAINAGYHSDFVSPVWGGHCVGRALLSAAFEFTHTFLADKSVRPTRAGTYKILRV